MINTKVFIKSYINKSGIPGPTVRVNGTRKSNLTGHDLSEGTYAAVRYYLGIHSPVSFIDTEDRLSMGSSSSFGTSSFNPLSTKVGFIHFNLTDELFHLL